MKPFRERNVTVIGIVSAVVLLAAVLVSLNFTRLPFNSQVTYHADLARAGQLVSSEEVTIAGVKVGTVKHLSLQGNHIRLDFTVNPSVHLGSRTTLTVKVLSVVGQEYVQLDSAGGGRMRPGDTIPLSRTFGTGTLVDTLNQLGGEIGQIDQAQLQKALEVGNQDLSGTSPAATAAVISGLGRVSDAINSRQAELSQLVNETEAVTQTLSDHKDQLVALIGQSNLILQVVEQRRTDLANLLSSVTSLSHEISSLVTDKHADLGSFLASLNTVAGVLAKDSDALGQTLPLAAGLGKYLANATGNGPYVDADAPTFLLPDTVVAGCQLPGAFRNDTSGQPYCDLNNNGQPYEAHP